MFFKGFRLDPESQLMLRLLCDAPLPVSFTPRMIKWQRFLNRASGGRVLYAVARALRDEFPGLFPPDLKPFLSRLIIEGDHRRTQCSDTLEHILRSLGGRLPFLVINTARTLPYVASDIKVLIRPDDHDASALYLTQTGGDVLSHSQSVQSRILVPELLPINLDWNFHRQGCSFVDADFMWRDSTTTVIEGIECPIPRATVEWTLIALSALYEGAYLSWLDYLALSHAWNPNRHDVHHDLISSQARKHGWLNGLLHLRKLVQEVDAACALAWGVDARFPNGNEVCDQLGAPVPFAGAEGQAKPRHAQLPLSFSVGTLVTLYYERWRRCRSIAGRDLFSALFAKLGSHVTRVRRFPTHAHWYDVSEVKS